MGRYVLITNVWGRQADKVYGWNYKHPECNLIYVDKEKLEFDTMEELNNYLELFKDYCSMFVKAERIKKYTGTLQWGFDSVDKRAWGWLIGDRETMNMTWGGEKLYNYNSKTDKRVLKDILFRGSDEVPEDYDWDDGEYEGWLQYRWGDGKNAIGYEDKKTNKTSKSEKVIEEDYDYDEYETIGEEIEDRYTKIEDKETIKKLENRW